MSGRMDGRVALLSGAARGIGAAQAELFAREGAAVVAADIREEQAAGLVERLRRDGLEATSVALDVRDPDRWEHAVDLAERAYGKLDTLVNNAGVVDFSGAAETSEEEWSRVIEVNQGGVFRGMRAAIPAFRRAGGGAIVNISSVYGFAAISGYFAYQASKAAVAQMTRAAAIEYAPEGIRVNAIAPGLIHTDMTAGEPAETVAENLALTPIGRAGEPRDIAYGTLYLAAEESSFVTGTCLVVDGGYLAQ